MKKILLKVILLVSFNLIARGHTNDSVKIRRNFVGLNLPGVSYDLSNGFYAAPAIGFERSISENKSFGGDLTYFSNRGFTGFMIRPEFRYYFKKDSLKRNKGLFLGAQIFDSFRSYRFLNSKSQYKDYYLNVNMIGLNLTGGYQWVWNNNLFFSLGLGYGLPPLYSYNYLDRNDSSVYFSKNWLNFDLFIRLGYSF